MQPGCHFHLQFQMPLLVPLLRLPLSSSNLAKSAACLAHTLPLQREESESPGAAVATLELDIFLFRQALSPRGSLRLPLCASVTYVFNLMQQQQTTH